MFIFYDIETTGTNISYDQILQFGAILADDNLVEVDRFEIRCRLLPWVVPAPSALLVTQTSTSELTAPHLLNFFDMMRAIDQRLASWGTATFAGYNSMRFDEPFLQRAFWQALFPPYVTVTGGNARLDLLPIIRVTSHLRPGILTLPMREDGKASFRLEGLAPANGFNAHRAHDAIGDVEATLFLAQLIAKRFPQLWKLLASRASKSSTVAILVPQAQVLYFHGGGTADAAFYMRIDTRNGSGSYAILARLDYDWRNKKARIGNIEPDEVVDMRNALRRVALNKAPLVFTLSEANTLAGLTPTSFELEQAQFLAGDSDYCLHLVRESEPGPREEVSDDREVEEMIFDGFASPSDVKLMAEFHRVAPPEKANIARSFADLRLRRLAMRILYLSAPQTLSLREREFVRLGIVRRLAGAEDGQHRWRAIPDALAELTTQTQNGLTLEQTAIAIWLRERIQNFD